MNAKPELTARCTIVVAAPGYGKTAAVHRWLRPAEARWHVGAIPAKIAPGWNVVDDLIGPSRDELGALLARLSRDPSTRVVLISRTPFPVPAGSFGPEFLDERGPADLSLTIVEVADVLNRHGLPDESLAAPLHDLSAGWPSLVHLVGERLARMGGVGAGKLDAGTIGGPGTGPAAFLVRHVLEPLPRRAACLVRALAQLGTVDENLYLALGHRRAEQIIDRLTRIGLIAAGGEGNDRSLIPLVRQAAADRWPLATDERAELFGRAGDWYAANGRPHEAINAYRIARRGRPCAALLREHGPPWVHAGGAAAIVAAVASLEPRDRTTEVKLLHGEALLVLGDDDRALAELTALAKSHGLRREPTGGRSEDHGEERARSTADEIWAAPTGDALPAGLAWRLAAAYCQRGDPHAASGMLSRARLAEPSTIDEAMLLAWTATARWMLGDSVGCGDLARRALHAADLTGDDRARCAAHVALAMHAMLAGDRPGNVAHYDHALRYARAVHDVVQAARIHTNQAARLLEEAQYPEALDQAREATALAGASGCSAILAVAVCNEAEALFRLGRLDEAMQGYARALDLFQSQRSNKVAYPLIGLGAIHRTRGRLSLAQAAYEEACRATTGSGDIQALVPALAGLARVLASTDPREAVRQAALARGAATGPYVTEAVLATGWALLGAGDRVAARRCAVDASTEARRHRDSRGLAEALELRAAATEDPAELHHVLREAAETWRLVGATLDRDRIVVALGSLVGASVTERIDSAVARERLDSAGVLIPAAVVPDTGLARSTARPVVIRSFGRFEVMVGEAVVTTSMWQSRKARELLCILVARRGRATAREELTELLWPEGERERLAHRLSVALSTVRLVLDPYRCGPADQFVVADRSGVALDVSRVVVDLEQFHDEARYGLTLLGRGRGAEARAALVVAERRYTGDFLENEPYEDWSVAAREEARATYLRIVRALAELSRQADLVDDAVQYQLKVLDKDPYDEHGHRELVETLAAAGRHGESRRANARYLAAMRAIGVAGDPPADTLPQPDTRPRPRGAARLNP